MSPTQRSRGTSSTWRVGAIGVRPLSSSSTALALRLLLIVALLSPATAAAQQAQRPQQAANTRDLLSRAGGFSASVEMVRVPVVVVDDGGSFIEDLAGGDFEIRDGGRPHRIEHFVSEAEPTSVGILIDASSPMAPFADEVRDATVRIAELLRAEDELFVLTYGESVNVLMAPAVDRQALTAATGEYRAEDTGRALYDAVARGLGLLADAKYDKRALIVIGAGGDTNSALGELAAQQVIQRAGVTIHAISLAPRASMSPGSTGVARVNRVQTLAELVRFTGGLVARRPRAFEPFGGVEGWLSAAASDISRYVNHQYLLHYTPRNPPRIGTWRSIQVRVDVDFERIRARSGYLR